MSIENDTYASYKLLERALAKLGYAMEFDDTSPATATYVGPGGKEWTTRAARIAYPFSSQAVRDVSIDKMKTYHFATEHGFVVPFTREFTGGDITKDEAEQLFETYGQLVIKPADSSSGRGVTLGVASYDQLVTAVLSAKAVSPRVLIQEQVAGEELRFTVINGKVENILLRRTAQVAGNGTATVAELIEQENDVRRKLQIQHVSYPQLDATLVNSSLLHSSRVPDNGEIVELNRSTLVSGGCSVFNVSDAVDKSYIAAVEDLVKELDAGLIVVDIFCADYTTPLSADNYRLIEFNTAPALKLYYGCRDGKQYDIATHLANLIDSHLSQSGARHPRRWLDKLLTK